jgi:uncharacterized Zn finger protein (UPF0148 family)
MSNTSLYFYLLAIACSIFLLFVARNSVKGKGRLRIPFDSIYCPICNTQQPFIRKPASLRQLLFGGVTCANCGVELDNFGKPIKTAENTSKINQFKSRPNSFSKEFKEYSTEDVENMSPVEKLLAERNDPKARS